MKLTTKGQVTILANLRVAYGLLPHSELEFIESKRGINYSQKENKNRRGHKLIEHVKGSSTRKMTIDDMMNLTPYNEARNK